MTSDVGVVLAVAIAAPPVLLWAAIAALLLKLRRRGRLPAGALRTVLVTGVGANVYPVASVLGAEPPTWLLVAGLAVAIGVGYAYMLAQLRRHRAVINGPWPEDPETARRRAERSVVNARYRAVVARLDENLTASDRAGVDAPALDETETR